MQKRITHADPVREQPADNDIPVRVVIVTMDHHLAGAVQAAERELRDFIPGIRISLHVASDWASRPETLAVCRREIARADIIVATMLFLEEHITAVLPDLERRRMQCDAIVGCMSAGEIIRLTRLGRFDMSAPSSPLLRLLKRLRGSSSERKSSGAGQMAMLKRLPRLLKFIPGTAQDVRSYFLTMQYWLAGSDDNIVQLVAYLVGRYADGPRRQLRPLVRHRPPIEYADCGIYHPDLPDRIATRREDLPVRRDCRGSVGLLLMRSYVLSRDTDHYDGVIRALEDSGLEVVPVFASGLDSREAIEKFFICNGQPRIDALVSLTGFSLVGGPAYNDQRAAEDILSRLDVPYLAAQGLELQSLESWQRSDSGLMPIESTMMLAIPELDGAIAPIVFGGRSEDGDPTAGRRMRPNPERVAMLAARVARLVELRRTPRAERRLAITLFNFPPNAGAAGTAAFLAVYESLFNVLAMLARAGYTVEVPESADALRTAILEGNAARWGADANVHAHIPAEDHVRREPHLRDIEAQWGPAPGRQLTDGKNLFVLGRRFGNILVGLQPGFGYEGDPMRLLFEKGFAPTHAFSAYYRYIREEFSAHAVLHFGTHGALEFMPGKQAGLSQTCWPDRLIADLPNFNLYSANNPSEGTLAKRRGSATLISYLTPPITRAGLYKGLLELKVSLDQWRALPPGQDTTRENLQALIRTQVRELDLLAEGTADTQACDIEALAQRIHEIETSLVPHGLHVVGRGPDRSERADLLAAMAEANQSVASGAAAIEAIVAGVPPRQAAVLTGRSEDAETVAALTELARIDGLLCEDSELTAIRDALDARYIRPVVGGDLLRSPDVLPTGRNIHGFDPFRMPSAFSVADGAEQARRLLARHIAEGHRLPRMVAIVLWGTDNMKSQGGPIAQALALIGARPRYDSYGRAVGAELLPLAELGRPRIDVIATLSGIFRDLLPLQARMLAEASLLAALADEPETDNFIRMHALRDAAELGCDLETAALRVFSNAEGAYGANVNHMVESGCWVDGDELTHTFSSRKCFAVARDGRTISQRPLLERILSRVDLAYQNLESIEVGVTTIDHYFDTLGGIGRAVRTLSGAPTPVYIGDQTRTEAKVRTLGEQVALETRTRALNPKWYEGMLKHGYEGVREIEAHVTNTMGWSATTGSVEPWVYQRLTETFVLDPDMRKRMADLNPKASIRVASRLLEAHERNYWSPDPGTLAALRAAGEDLEDQFECRALAGAA
ncbi:MAG: magnesium chelatase subunit H [Rhizobiales bacterium]|nr:magnesium chelatase subunit H [Hyphomicrobiales bacterium]